MRFGGASGWKRINATSTRFGSRCPSDLRRGWMERDMVAWRVGSLGGLGSHYRGVCEQIFCNINLTSKHDHSQCSWGFRGFRDGTTT